ncbi:MAG: BlaI/MecI/CopY family transcriptional regulator [Lachnospiraceae bacterium]|nr:BlaI/MecI/CopY family transcriptional regulator [Lachnospiraceae bacterium]
MENRNGNISLNHSEWCILEALWQEQPKTLMRLVRDMKDKQGWSKSTTNTMLRRMQEKAYIRYEEGEKARLYCTDLKREEVVLKETESFLKRTYGGSLGMLVNTFVENNQLTDRDIEQLQEILHRAEEKKGLSSEQKKEGR